LTLRDVQRLVVVGVAGVDDDFEFLGHGASL
jgi:hypothetical protein